MLCSTKFTALLWWLGNLQSYWFKRYKKKLGLVVVICFTGLTNIDLSKYNNNTLGNLYFSTGGFCHCLGNISLQYHSSQNAIQLFTIVKQSLKYYGINKILEPFMEDIKALENVSSCFFIFLYHVCISRPKIIVLISIFTATFLTSEEQYYSISW